MSDHRATARWRGTRPWTRHSLVLVVAGFVYVGIGLSYITTQPTESRVQSLSLALRWMPLQAWGVVFLLVGVAAIVSSRWPPTSETWGYTAMTSLSAGWAGFYAAGVFLGAPGQALSSVLVWSLIAFMWWAVSGLVNPATGVPR